MSETTTTELYPTLKAELEWFPDAKAQPYITEIHILDRYTPTGTEDAAYTSAVDPSGTESGDGARAIMVYRIGTQVIIAGNGSGKIYLNENSCGMFAHFYSLERITGLELLDGSKVTNLGGAFNFCHHLKEVDISMWWLPQVTNLNAMFSDCERLERVRLPQAGVSMVSATNIFQNCVKLKEVDYLRGATRLCLNAFSNCTALERVTGLEQIRVIEEEAFMGCSSLKQLEGLEYVTTIGENAFFRCYHLKQLHFRSVSEIARGAFAMCVRLEEVTGLGNVTVIQDGVFLYCIGLKRISNLSRVTTVGELAFYYTPVLRETGLQPENITAIGKAAFHCSSVEDVTPMDAATGTVGDFATRKKRWGDELQTVQSAGTGTYFLNVPFPDSQTKYPDLPYKTTYVADSQTEGDSGEQTEAASGEETVSVPNTIVSVADAACVAFSLYHMEQVFDKRTNVLYTNFRDWYYGKLGGTRFAMSLDAKASAIMQICEGYLGWNYAAKYNVYSVLEKNTMIAALAEGKPTMISVNNHDDYDDGETTIPRFHIMAVIGYDRETDKFAIVDSGIYGMDGVVLYFAYEDLFAKAGNQTDSGYNCIHVINFEKETQAE